MHLTPGILRAAYEFLRATPPFRGWGMPDGDAVAFRVMRHKDLRGQCFWDNGRPVIDVSAKNVGHTDNLLQTMAHEMVHIHLDRNGVRSDHGADFRAGAVAVCRHHGWDVKLF